MQLKKNGYVTLRTSECPWLCVLNACQAKRRREEEEAARKKRHDAEYAQKLNEQIREDVQRQQLERERFQQARKRAMSDATEVPWSEDATPTESFDFEIKWQGQSFRQVRLFHPRQGAFRVTCLFWILIQFSTRWIECLGTIYQADPICDEPLTYLPLELLSITFVSHYYTTTQGTVFQSCLLPLTDNS